MLPPAIEVEQPLVTPTMQSEMRSGQRKSLKRGRKPKGKGEGKSKATKGKKTKATRKKIGKKRTMLLKASPKKSAKKGKKGTPEAQEPASKASKKRSKTSQPKASEPAESSKAHQQERVYLNTGAWRYQVVEGQTLGCTNCRFIFNGCRSCRKPSFRGKKAADLLAEAAAENAPGECMPELQTPKGKAKGKKVRKGCKAKK